MTLQVAGRGSRVASDRKRFNIPRLATGDWRPHKTLLIAALVLAAALPLRAEDSATAPDSGVTPKKWVFAAFDDRVPYHVREADGAIRGFDAAIIQEISRLLKRPVEIRLFTEPEVLRAIGAGELDGVLGVTENRPLARMLDVSSPYFINKTRLFVHEETDFIRTLKDLKGVRVGITPAADVGDFLKLVPGVKLVMEPNAETGLRDLVAKKITVFLGDEHESQYHIRTKNLGEIKTVGGALILKRRMIGIRKGNRDFLSLANGALDQMKREFTLQTIQEDWFGRSPLWGHTQRKFLMVLLAALGFFAAVLLAALLWNQRLSDAVARRTQELEAEREHFRNIFDHASDGILIINPHDTGIMEANRAFEEMSGYSKEELMGMRLEDVDASGEEEIIKHVASVMQQGASTMFEVRIRSKANMKLDLLIHARPFPYKGRTMAEAIVRDVTERKKVQEMKDTILQDVAHELKTPMSKMTMSIDLLERNLKNDDRTQYEKFFDICRRSIQRLQSTIDGILNLSRLESQTMQMEPDVIAIQDVLLTVIDELMVFGQRKGIQITHALPPQAILIKGDVDMLTRLFINIIHNAIKFTDRGEIRVTASREELFAKVSVKDDGIGLDPEDLKKIFGRFYQKTPTYEGCGIGLTIAQKIVSLHNGVIWAESEGPGKGTTMNVMFPLHKFAQKPDFLKANEKLAPGA